jgi:hypothetical protein
MTARKILSAHKLIEYAFAIPQRRVKIIENALQPPTFIMDTMYPDIERATGPYLVSQCTDPIGLENLDQLYQTRLAKIYREREVLTDHHEQRLFNAMDAISHVRDMDWALPSKCTVELAQSVPTGMEICGIEVRIKPSVLLKRREPGFRDPFIGVVKPYFGKTSPLRSVDDMRRGVLFATLLHWFAESALDFLGTADPKMCYVADVFDEKTHFAATRYKQRRKQIEALALEIFDRWEPIAERLEDKVSTRVLSTK